MLTWNNLPGPKVIHLSVFYCITVCDVSPEAIFFPIKRKKVFFFLPGSETVLPLQAGLDENGVVYLYDPVSNVEKCNQVGLG